MNFKIGSFLILEIDNVLKEKLFDLQENLCEIKHVYLMKMCSLPKRTKLMKFL